QRGTTGAKATVAIAQSTARCSAIAAADTRSRPTSSSTAVHARYTISSASAHIALMSLSIDPVERGRELSAFIDVSWKIPAAVNHPQWVPPLRMMTRDLLDTKSNPFYREADRALFIARRDGKPVGRIAAIENRAHNAFHADRTGFFGFFECVDDPEAAHGLFSAAEAWLRARGLATIRGPMNPSTSQDCGLLVDGFDQQP